MALTEPNSGSDALETTARLSEDGKHYILNGQKNMDHKRVVLVDVK